MDILLRQMGLDRAIGQEGDVARIAGCFFQLRQAMVRPLKPHDLAPERLRPEYVFRHHVDMV